MKTNNRRLPTQQFFVPRLCMDPHSSDPSTAAACRAAVTFIKSWLLAALMFGMLSVRPSAAQELQTEITPANSQTQELESLRIQLNQQAAEIQSLREYLAEQHRATQVAPVRLPTANALPAAGPTDMPNYEFASTSAANLEGLTERVKALEAAQAKSAPPKTADGWTDISNEKWTIKLGGHVQGDFVHWAHADSPPVPASDYFEFRRLRLLADGTGYGVYDFRLQIDIEPEGEETVTTPVTVVKDAYLTMNEIPIVDRIRFGNFFVPFSLEQVTNDTNNIFLERAIPTTGVFAADREVGVAMYGVNDSQSATWSLGAFIDNISEALKERIDDNQGHRLSGRVTWVPFYDEASNGRYLFHVGAGMIYTDDQDDSVRFRARPQIHEGPFLIDSGNRAADSFTSANIELATVWGSWSVQSELFLTQVDLATGNPADLYGAYVYVSYFLTGENRIYERYGQHSAQFARNVPTSNFFVVPGGVGPGAWEAKARLSYLDLDELAAGRYNDFTAGFNWYWTERIRWMFEWIHPVTSAATPFGHRESDLLGLRLDFNW